MTVVVADAALRTALLRFTLFVATLTFPVRDAGNGAGRHRRRETRRKNAVTYRSPRVADVNVRTDRNMTARELRRHVCMKGDGACMAPAVVTRELVA